ncbi:MAG TPA: hypothetical protein VFI69_11360 [Candidatus Limnocylindrales bacterium]|jgi:hypothetical protein|nr:hypothetical protein [Candidatus Limnocylindrales bacterium]
MHQRPRRLLALLPLILAASACGSSAPTTAVATAGTSPATPSEPASPAASESAAASGSPTGDATASAAGVDQTDTAWGRIWDAVPAGFPRFPGSVPGGDASGEPASGRFVVAGGDPADVASWMQSALETATYSTEALSGPLEDGSFVLDSVGEGACRIETTVAPLGGMTFITIRYGADCPAA